jgi:hypothetical protein
VKSDYLSALKVPEDKVAGLRKLPQVVEPAALLEEHMQGVGPDAPRYMSEEAYYIPAASSRMRNRCGK